MIFFALILALVLLIDRVESQAQLTMDALKTTYRIAESTVTFLKGSKTKNYFPIIRLDGTLQYRTDSAAAPIPEEVKITTNEIGDIGCWYERDSCIICG